MATTQGSETISTGRRLPAGRKAELASYVNGVGEVTVAQLAERFEVSPDTIRRDLDRLDADGVLLRTHGGAVSLSGFPKPDSALDVRIRVQAEAKERIGELAAGLVEDNTAITVNSGTTTLALARHLRGHRELTIATNNLRLPQEISPECVRDLYLIGGTVRFVSQATVGPVVFESAENPGDVHIRADLALIAVGAVSVEQGWSTSNLGEAAMMAGMINRAAKVAVLADSSKFGRQLFARIASLEAADYLVTERAPEGELAEALAAAGVEVITP
ncbi:MAG: DeoR/GlpR transcriptional regulator [Salana multivorans]|uniref:DeoR/GlpR family DNA-binding transcription regulator n=1 Tax=Salana multivorans TaxID=120377 RepID=UPI000B288D0A|nr:DeoR/GlpR family DNA-binding transcription regulator [Salana multivorans]MBN8882239.1 DeoR/GlpR transcriptional regulator [Salana multivorans]